MSTTVRVIETCVLTFDGAPTPLRAGDAYNADEPIVQTFPWAFRADNTDGDVESATANPGERRATRRP